MVGRSTVVVTAESQAQLQELAGSHERGEADRARAILLTLAGWSSGRIGEAFGVREDTVRLWRMTFMQGGVAGLRTDERRADRGTHNHRRAICQV